MNNQTETVPSPQAKAVAKLIAVIDGGLANNLIPLVPGDKRPLDVSWQDRVYSRAELIERVGAGANVGLRLDQFVVIDVEHSDAADAIREYISKRHPDAPMRYRPGSSSVAFLFAKAEKDISGWKIQRPEGIDGDHVLLAEILAGHGRQLHVLGPRHDKKGVELQWSEIPSLLDLPVLSQEDVKSIGAHTIDLLRSRSIDCRLTNSARPSSLSSASGPADLMSEDMLRKALASIPNDDAFMTRDAWIEMGHAIFGASYGSDWGKDLWIEWSDQTDQKPGEPERVWNSFSLDTCRTGAGFIRKQLSNRGNADLHDEARQQAAADLFDDDLPPKDERAAADASPMARRPKSNRDLFEELLRDLEEARQEPGQSLVDVEQHDRFGFISFGEQRQLAVPYIEPRIVDTGVRGELTLLIAPPGGGKSTYTSVLALSVGYGRPDLIGEKTIDWIGDVVIVSNEEDSNKFRARLTACRQYHGLPAQSPQAIRLLPAPLSIMRTTNSGPEPSDAFLEFIRQLIALRREQPIAVVIFDTLAATMGAGDENNAEDMQALCDIAVRLARSCFCAVYLIHHVRKSAGTDGHLTMFAARGSGAVPGSARAVWGMQPFNPRDADNYRLPPKDARQCVLLRDLKHDAFEPRAFKFERHNVVAVDPRRPDDFLLRPTPILVPIELPETGGDLPLIDEALRALVTAHDGGTAIRRGSATGARPHEHQAKCIIAYEVLDFDPTDKDGKKRALSQAWAIVEALTGKGFMVEADPQRDARGHNFVPLVPTEAARDRLQELDAQDAAGGGVF